MNKCDSATLRVLTACYEFWHFGLKTPATLHMSILTNMQKRILPASQIPCGLQATVNPVAVNHWVLH